MPLLNATGAATTAVTAATVTQDLSRLLILHQPPCGWSPRSGPAPAQPQCALPPHGAICKGFHLRVRPSTGRTANACIPVGLSQGEGVAGAAGEFDPDRFVLEVFVDRGEAVLPAEPRGSVAAKGHAGSDDPVGIDPYRAGAQLGRHPVGAVDVLGPHRAGQAVRSVVGQLQRLVFTG